MNNPFWNDIGNLLGAVGACALYFYLLRWIWRLSAYPLLMLAVGLTKFMNWLSYMAFRYAQWSAHRISKTWVLPK
jgi:hypothetical protein